MTRTLSHSQAMLIASGTQKETTTWLNRLLHNSDGRRPVHCVIDRPSEASVTLGASSFCALPVRARNLSFCLLLSYLSGALSSFALRATSPRCIVSRFGLEGRDGTALLVLVLALVLVLTSAGVNVDCTSVLADGVPPLLSPSDSAPLGVPARSDSSAWSLASSALILPCRLGWHRCQLVRDRPSILARGSTHETGFWCPFRMESVVLFWPLPLQAPELPGMLE